MKEWDYVATVSKGVWLKICLNSLKVSKMKDSKNKTHRNALKSNFVQRFCFNTSMYAPWPSNSSIHGTCIASPSARFIGFPVILTQHLV